MPPVQALPAGDGLIGYVGGSLTRNAVEGYHLVGGQRFWDGGSANLFGGGQITSWAEGLASEDDDPLWRPFNRLTAANADRGQTTGLWVQLLSRGETSPEETYSAAVAVLDELVNRFPGAELFVSAMNGYTDPNGCVPPEVPAQMQALADQLVAEGRASPGPVMGNLAPDQTSDGCHANDDGRRVLGETLQEFFG